jgi:hypothetical protein
LSRASSGTVVTISRKLIIKTLLDIADVLPFIDPQAFGGGIKYRLVFRRF